MSMIHINTLIVFKRFLFVLNLVLFSVQIRYPTYIGDVAEVCLQLCEQRIKQVFELFLSILIQFIS